MAIRFIHASDLHLGRRFANIPQPPDGNIRGRLMEARHAAISRIASAARKNGASHILLAGDTFDTATPSDSVVRQALAAMCEADGIHWWILPGNHDNLQNAEPLWETITRDAPVNVRALIEAEPVELTRGVMLLPCPVAFRSSGRDLTDSLATMPSPENALRIGLAHGGVIDFTESGANIPPDRDRTAQLDYLALGDWHGRVEVSSRTHYSGSPEQDRFKHARRGGCLSVTIDGPGATPQVEEVETGAFLWTQAELPLLPDTNAAESLDMLLPEMGRRDVLIRVRVSGWAGLQSQSDLRQATARLGPEFAHFEFDIDQLGTIYDTADLDEIDRAGALRLAADRLKAEAEAETLSADEREVSADALARLYAYVREAAQ